MYAPYGWVTLLTGMRGAVIFIVNKIRGTDTKFALFVAGLAAFSPVRWHVCRSPSMMQIRRE